MMRKAVLAVCLAGCLTLAAQDPRETYQIDFGVAPVDGASALASLPQRAKATLAAQACGDEFGIYFDTHTASAGEGTGGTLVAKTAWFAQALADGLKNGGSVQEDGHILGIPPCVQQRKYTAGDFEGAGNQPKRDLSPAAFDNTGLLTDPAQFAAGLQAAVIAQFNKGTGEACRSFSATAKAGDPAAGDGGLFVFTYSVPLDCLRAQVNAAIQIYDQNRGGFHMSGTDGAVCWEKGFTIPGDWDVNIRDLTRVYYLNKNMKVTGILDGATQDYLVNQLLTLRKGPGPDSYGLADCANSGDYSTGSPDDAGDEDSWSRQAVKSVGDGLGWFLSRALLFLVAAVAAAVTGGIVLAVDPSTGINVILALVSGGAAVAGSVASIPETENHRLMIETSRYLYDQLAAATAKDSGNSAKWAQYGQQVKGWLLPRLQSIAQKDFIEYNARPYQRYSTVALLNLYDFADDPQLRTAAQIVLEYQTLKFALASSQGRRSVPFRRRTEAVTGVTSIFELHEVDDYQVGQMLLFTGQTQQLPNGRVSIYGIGDIVYAASSTFLPDTSILNLAIRKDVPYYQQLRHSEAVEIYSGARSYVLSAGGIRAPAAYPEEELGIAAPGGGSWNPLISSVDRGAAVPTVLMVAVGNGDTDRKSFVRIEGGFTDFGSAGAAGHPNWHNTTYEHNSCVWKGFACGMNVVAVPMAGCVLDAAPGWQFIDSAACAGGSPKFYVAIHSEPCSPDGDDACQVTPGNGPMRANKGFFEVVDNPAEDFATFKSKVMSLNPQPFALAGTASYGTYHAYSGHTIEFDCEAHQHDSDKWGISRIDGVDQPGLGKWPFASGDIVNGAGDGRLTISIPGFRQILYDFTKTDSPVRTLK